MALAATIYLDLDASVKQWLGQFERVVSTRVSLEAIRSGLSCARAVETFRNNGIPWVRSHPEIAVDVSTEHGRGTVQAPLNFPSR